MDVSEPAVAYNSVPELQSLKSRLISAIDKVNDKETLLECLELLDDSPMPCMFTDEELDEEIRLSEASGFITQEEFLAELAKWGFER